MTREITVEDHASGAKQTLAGLFVCAACFTWCAWPVLKSLVKDWSTDANYSVGELVPLAAAYVIWQMRAQLKGIIVRPAWFGLFVVFAGFAAVAYGLVYLFESLERYGMLLVLVGMVLILFGWTVFARLKWVMLFLFLMIPLPGMVHNRIAGPLQTVATQGAVMSLELLGSTVLREGHVITLNGTPLAVAEACSGLRMLTAFIVVGSALAFLVHRPAWQKTVLVFSTVPIAILCNLMRLVATAYLFAYVDGPMAEKFFHDFAGWFMMPLAIAIMLGELWVMARLVAPDKIACSRTEFAL